MVVQVAGVGTVGERVEGEDEVVNGGVGRGGVDCEILGVAGFEGDGGGSRGGEGGGEEGGEGSEVAGYWGHYYVWFESLMELESLESCDMFWMIEGC